MNFLYDKRKEKERKIKLLIKAIADNNFYEFKKVLEEAIKNKKLLSLNEELYYKDGFKVGTYNLLTWSSIYKNKSIFKYIIDYAITNKIALDINRTKYNDHYSYVTFPLLWAVNIDDVIAVKKVIEYAQWRNVTLNINEKDKKKGDFPLLNAIQHNNTEMVKLLLNYANRHSIFLNICNKNDNNDYPFHLGVQNDSTEIIKLLIDYAIINDNFLNINDKSSNEDFPLLSATKNNNTEMVKKIIDYATKNYIVLDINDKNLYEEFPLLNAVKNNNVEMVNILIDYATTNNLTLNMNDKELNGDFIILKVIQNNNVDMVKALMKYTNKNNDESSSNNKNVLFPMATDYDINMELIKLLIRYSNDKNAVLKDNNLIRSDSIPIQDILTSYEEEQRINEVIAKEKGKQKAELEEKELKEKIENEERELKEKIEKEAREMRERIEREEKEMKEKIQKEEKEMKEKIKQEEREMRERIEMEIRKRVEEEVRERIETEVRKRIENAIVDSGLYQNIDDDNIINENKNNNNNSNNTIQLKTPMLVIVTKTYTADEYDQIDITKNEFLVVTNWCYKEGWVYGHRKDCPEEKGIFPKIFIRICSDENKDNATFKFDITPEYRIHFEEKVNQLRTREDMQVTDANLFLTIRRNYLFDDAYTFIMGQWPGELKKRLKIDYQGEEGLDAGGLLRDFFYNISREIGNPNYSFFQYSNNNSYELEINPKSGSFEPEHLKYFRFIGRILGLAIYHKQYLSINFTLLFYKKLLNKRLNISDLQYLDPEIYKSINWIKENDGVDNLCLTFELDTEDCFGNHKKVELKPNGVSIDLTDQNKDEYIDLVVQYKLNNGNDKEQFDALKLGFYDIVPRDINETIDEFDLKFLMTGINEINVDDWENNTDYEGYKKDDDTIINFWKCVKDFNAEKKKKLLLFATGNSQVPVTGFKDLQGSGKIQHFKLKKVGNANDLPISHTCFNRIDLPPYTSYTQLKQKLLYAISEGMGGFSME